MNYGPVYIDYCRVIPEPSSIPSSPAKTIAVISIAIINTAIETDTDTPIAGVKAVKASGITPISGRP